MSLTPLTIRRPGHLQCREARPGTVSIDMLFVAPQFQRRGVARQPIRHVETHARSVQVTELTADVSITARPFFERHGFTAETEQHPVRGGVPLTNYRMKKKLLDSAESLSG